MCNKDFMTDPTFLAACEKAGVIPTKKQVSKFRSFRGAAYEFGLSQEQKDEMLEEVEATKLLEEETIKEATYKEEKEKLEAQERRLRYFKDQILFSKVSS